jgi:iron complex outermembrane receptor protein
MRPLLLALCVALAAAGSGAAEPQDALPGQSPGPAESSRRERPALETPLSSSSVERDELQRGKPDVQVDESVVYVPGVFTQSAPNFAQDARVSIRGYGARTPFGIRGIKVYVDGIPTTLPDGQTEVDSIDMAFIERVDVVRGPVSSLYGGGGGGVLWYETLAPTAEPHANGRALWGSYGLERYELTTSGTAGGLGIVAGYASTTLDGYRDHAAARQQSGILKLEHELDSGTKLRGMFSGVWAPEAQDPGGLNALEVARDRRASRPGAVLFDAGEALDQQKLALDVAHTLEEGHELRLRGYYLHRDFANFLPFTDGGRVKLARNVAGASLVYDGEWSRLQWLAGVETDLQSDLRRRFDNQSGTTGRRRLDQAETVRSVGAFGELELRLPHQLGLIVGGRYDWLDYDADDRFISPPDMNGDDSSSFRLGEFSPRVGVYLDHAPGLFLYANLLSAFRPPTTTELAYPLDLERGGFRTDLDPELSRGVEVGARGLLGERLFYELAAFYLQVRDAIVPFEDASGQNLTRNAGRVRRIGLEVGLGARLRPGLEIRAAYTWSDFVYTDYDFVSLSDPTAFRSFARNREPGTPVHNLTAELRFEHGSGAWAVLGVRTRSTMYVNDENSATSSGATVSDIRVGYDWHWRGLLLRPFASLRNWTGVEYDGQVRPNAAFGRYYEPAPEAEWLAGLELRWGERP